MLPAIIVTAGGLGLGFVAATAGVDVGGSLGLAVLATLAASRTADAVDRGTAPPQADRRVLSGCASG